MSPRPRTPRKTSTKRAAAKPAPTVERARRLTQAELVERLLASTEAARRPRGGVQLERGPRGQVLITVNVHLDDEPDLDTLAAVRDRAVKIFSELERKYPVGYAERGA
ncbi:MAG TPA: hypothetical protein VGN14_14320 [Candidatus Elarobacter sp.]